MSTLVRSEVLPNLGPASALRGVFLGDEVCCYNASCYASTLAPVAAKFRALLGPGNGLLYGA